MNLIYHILLIFYIFRRKSQKCWYLIKFGVQGATELHILDQVGALALIRGDDADLIGFGSCLQQPGGDFLNVCSLSP